MGAHGDDCVHGGPQVWRPGGLSLSGFPVLRKEVGTLGCCDWEGRAEEQLGHWCLLFEPE